MFETDQTVDTDAAAKSWAHPDRFARRHIGPGMDEIKEMLAALELSSLAELADAAVPAQIRTRRRLNLPAARSEEALLTELRGLARENQVYRSYLGMGYADCITPPVLQRNVLENPGWYPPYTPYQAEVAQG